MSSDCIEGVVGIDSNPTIDSTRQSQLLVAFEPNQHWDVSQLVKGKTNFIGCLRGHVTPIRVGKCVFMV